MANVEREAADLSIIIPSHKEPYLQKTIDSLHHSAKEGIEVIVALDDYWPDEPLRDCISIHAGFNIGMRTAINMAVSQSRSRYIMKTDGHCLFPKGFDVTFKRDCEPKWVIVPPLYGLKMDRWRKWGCGREFFYIRKNDFRGADWPEFAERVKGQKLCDLMTFQGSCFFMERDWFHAIGGEDDVNYAGSGREAQEISIKTWLNGGRCVLDRNLWYAHWRKGRDQAATLKRGNRGKSKKYVMKRYETEIEWLVKKFNPVPTWHEESNENSTN